MGRRRLLVLAPAITRMQCMSNPYKRIDGKDKELREERVSFWSSWRRRKGAKKAGSGGSKSAGGGARRKWGFRMSRLRIRKLSPLYWLKKLRDSYVNMMLSIERNAGDCSGMSYGPSYAHPYSGGGIPWVWPTLVPPF